MSNLAISPVYSPDYFQHFASSIAKQAGQTAPITNSNVSSLAGPHAAATVHSNHHISAADYLHLNQLCANQNEAMNHIVDQSFTIYLYLVYAPDHIAPQWLNDLGKAIDKNHSLSNSISALSHRVGSGTPELAHLAVLSAKENKIAGTLQHDYANFKHAFEAAKHPLSPEAVASLRHQFVEFWNVVVRESELSNEIYATAASLPIKEISEHPSAQMVSSNEPSLLSVVTQTRLNSRVMSSSYRL